MWVLMLLVAFHSLSIFCLSSSKAVWPSEPPPIAYLSSPPYLWTLTWGDRDLVARWTTQATCCIWIFTKMEVKVCTRKRKSTHLSSSLKAKSSFQRGAAPELVPCLPWAPKAISAGTSLPWAEWNLKLFCESLSGYQWGATGCLNSVAPGVAKEANLPASHTVCLLK